MLFLGTYTPRLDEKGRMILPAKYRDKLSDGLVITRGQKRCLFIYAQADFEAMAAQWQASPTTSKAVRDHQRVFLSGASDEVPDKQGRITIPPALRTYAGLDRDLAVIGAGSRAEIWAADAWDSYLTEKETAFSETDEDAFPGII